MRNECGVTRKYHEYGIVVGFRLSEQQSYEGWIISSFTKTLCYVSFYCMCLYLSVVI